MQSLKQPIAADDNNSLRETKDKKRNSMWTSVDKWHKRQLRHLPLICLAALSLSPLRAIFRSNATWQKRRLVASHISRASASSRLLVGYFPHRHADRSLHPRDVMDAPCDARNSTPSFRGVQIMRHDKVRGPDGGLLGCAALQSGKGQTQ